MTALMTVVLALAASAPVDIDRALAEERAILAELVAADTSNPPGNEERAVAPVARRLKKAGIPFEIVYSQPHRANLVARLKGNGSKKPLLLLAHIDVVPADASKWSTPTRSASKTTTSKSLLRRSGLRRCSTSARSTCPRCSSTPPRIGSTPCHPPTRPAARPRRCCGGRFMGCR